MNAAAHHPARVFANLGSGPAGERSPPLFDGWRELRVDIEPAVRPDVIADLTDLSPIPAGSVQGVWCSHALEHLYAHEIPVALAEIRRILAPDGIFCALVPDLQTVAQAIAADRLGDALYASPAGPISAHDVVFGHGAAIARGLTHMAHRSGFTPSLMIARMKAAGFSEFMVFRRPNFELCALAHRTAWPSPAERDALASRLRA